MNRSRATKFRRLYRCLECGKGTYFSQREENRAGRLRCTACGSARLEPSAAGAGRQAATNDAIRDIAAAVDQNGTGSVVPH